jgi:tRNA pseudouridine(38-40) synthase
MAGCPGQREPVRTMERVDVVETERGLRIEVESSGFLYKQVRNMVGLLIDVGRGKRAPAIVATILDSRDREAFLYKGAAAQVSERAMPCRGLECGAPRRRAGVRV